MCDLQMRGRPIKNWQNALEIYIEKSKKRVKPYTIKKYRWSFSRFFRDLEEAGLETHPQKLTEKEIRYLLDVAWKGLEPSTRRGYVLNFSAFLQRFGNTVIKDMGLKLPKDARTNVDWLTPEESLLVLDEPLSPLEMIVIHCELCLGLRNVEVKRLCMDDIGQRHLTIKGKGSDVGKWRTVPFHEDTPNVLRIWLAERSRMIAEARKYRPNIEVPDNLVIWKAYVRKPKIGAYSEESNGLTKITIRRIRDRMNLYFANHTLRRTMGREIWLSKLVQTESITLIYGHEDMKTTLDYIGVNYDDMSYALDVLKATRDERRERMKEKKKEELT